MATQLKIGIIGTGWIAGHHMNGYRRNGKAEIVAVADINEKAAWEFIKKEGLNCKYYKDYRELLKDSDVQSVSICAPNKFHSEMTVAAANAGKHMLAEKPFVTSV